jgi:hypothetical protein
VPNQNHAIPAETPDDLRARANRLRQHAHNLSDEDRKKVDELAEELETKAASIELESEE